MLSSFSKEQILAAGPNTLSDELERGRIVHFPQCPIPLPEAADLAFLRDEMPKQLNSKNISFHPEAGKVNGLKGDRVLMDRVTRILKEHSSRVQDFLGRKFPSLTRDWMVGTSSFRPLQERGRDLSPHASNELVHVDAGAYGATHGDRIVRFFVNVNPVEDRVWVSKGAFPELYRRYGRAAGVERANGDSDSLEEGAFDKLRTGAVNVISKLLPTARMLDSSPYDRAMRRFHNYMKDTPDFQSAVEGHQDYRFKPFESWMVFTDMVSHACISGQFAFVDTFVVPLANCRLAEMAPINILKQPIADA